MFGTFSQDCQCSGLMGTGTLKPHPQEEPGGESLIPRLPCWLQMCGFYIIAWQDHAITCILWLCYHLANDCSYPLKLWNIWIQKTCWKLVYLFQSGFGVDLEVWVYPPLIKTSKARLNMFRALPHGSLAASSNSSIQKLLPTRYLCISCPVSCNVKFIEKWVCQSR